MIIPVILAGGAGTRLWPLSRRLYPKQFMQLVESHTLLQNTLLRLSPLAETQPPIVVCNDAHRFIVAEQLREIGIQPQAIILEPVRRNTAPAITAAGLIAHPEHENSILLVLPADHYIPDCQGLVNTVVQGVRFAQQGRLVTIGVVPRAPETGYGYIRKGESIVDGQAAEGIPAVWRIDQFVEKPALETAKSYFASGDYCWNSGMFMFRAGRFLEEMQAHAPDILAACRSAMAKADIDSDFYRLDKAAFEACPSDSIDYAVMEKTDCGVVVALESPWSDLGSWEALWQAGSKDSDGNVVHGDACLHNVKNSFVYTSGRLVTAVGLTGHVVVDTKDAVFVAPRDHVQQVSILVDRLKSGNRTET